MYLPHPRPYIRPLYMRTNATGISSCIPYFEKEQSSEECFNKAIELLVYTGRSEFE